MIDAGRRSRARARGFRLAGFAFLAIAALGITSAIASASDHRYWTSFGDGLIGDERYSPNGASIAVDNSDGSSAHDVYVSDTTNQRVLKFSPEGGFILMFGDEVDATTGGDVCTAASGDQCKAGVPSPWEISEEESSPGFSAPAALAVDGSAGPAAGDVYVVDRPHGRVLRFDPGGHRDTTWATEGELRLSGATGVAVDANGRLLVLDIGPSQDLVRTFDPNAAELGSVNVNWQGYAEDLEVDGAGKLYVPTSYTEVAEFAADGSRLRGFTVEARRMTGFAVDGATGNVFLSRGSEGIGAYPAGCPGDPCAPAEVFGEGFLNWAGDLAIDKANQTLYAIDHHGGASVAVFLPANQIPEVTTGSSAVRGEHEADLRGTIDATGAPPAIGCRFEYVTEAVFEDSGFAAAPSAPCTQPTPISSRKNVAAHIGGLERGASYRFRLVAGTATKTVVGRSGEFRTLELPVAKTGPAQVVETASALLSGSVESPPAKPIFGCTFQVVSYPDYLQSYFDKALTFPCEPGPFYEADRDIAVTSRANFLQAGTSYRYRITAVNLEATVHGLTQAFTTTLAVSGSEPEEPVERPHRPGPRRPSGKTPCARKACTELLHGSPHARVWVSPRFPASYGWLFEIIVKGHPLHHTALEKGCRSTFAGHGVIARLNGCRGRFRIVYRGSGPMRLRWRVFAKCRCAEAARAAPSP